MKSTTERREYFERLIEAAERDIKKNPRLYNAKVAMLAILGYAVVFSMLIVLLMILGGIGWVSLVSASILILLVKSKMIFAIIAMTYVLVRALWVKFTDPQGYQLNRKEYPLLYNEINRLRRKLSTPYIHQVILMPEYNAAIVQTPRLGLLGWYKNTLYLGLELLLSMSPAQASSVIAHELGHLSGKHNRFSGWIYRVRLSWNTIMIGLQEQHNFGANLLRRFFNWYSPTFAAYSFALARANEYSADAVAVQLTSPDDVSHALVNSHVVHDLLSEQFWHPYIRLADTCEKPKSHPFSELISFLQNHSFEHSAVHAHIEKAMSMETNHFNTHPALKDRLHAINSLPTLPEGVKESAAKLWLNDKLPEIIKYFDEEWLQQNAVRWRERFDYVQQGREKLNKLRAKAIDELNGEEFWQLAVLTEEFETDTDCLPIYEGYKARYPDDLNVDFAIARILLNRENETGVELMKSIMAQQQNLRFNACEWLAYFYCKRKDKVLADYWQQQAKVQRDIDTDAQLEREDISSLDELSIPEADSHFYGRIRDAIQPIGEVKHAWMAEKKMRHYPEAKTYILVFEKAMFSNESIVSELIISKLKIDCVCFVILKGGVKKAIAKKAIKNGVQLF
jgi:Zn-dependent protease with chaperone function